MLQIYNIIFDFYLKKKILVKIKMASKNWDLIYKDNYIHIQIQTYIHLKRQLLWKRGHDPYREFFDGYSTHLLLYVKLLFLMQHSTHPF